MTDRLRPETHRRIEPRLSGEVLVLAPGAARIGLTTTAEMIADDTGLIHGGFIFGLADHAAMLAVNHPNVVLGSAEVRFVKPVTLGDQLLADARVEEREGRQAHVHVVVSRWGEVVFTGEFICFVPERHVLEGVKA